MLATRLHCVGPPPAVALSLGDLHLGAMSSSPLFGPNPCTYGVPFVVVSVFLTFVSFLYGLTNIFF